MTSLYPEIRDTSSLSGVFNTDQFMLVGVEGRKDTVGTAAVAQPYVVSDPAVADTLFGPASSLSSLVKFLLGRGLNNVIAVASASNVAPTLVQRQAAWTVLEEDENVRIRLTDSTVQADLVALADSAEWAEGIQHKQFMFGGMALPSSQATLLAMAGAVASKRGIIVGPGVYDTNGTLLAGPFAAAYVAAAVAMNQDITDDMDGMPLPATTGIERDATNNMPLFRNRAGAGVPLNDFAVLLAGGVSPLRQGRAGQAEITHIRMTWTTDTTYDALMTLLIKDGTFLALRDLLLGQKFLRRGNTASNRALAAKLVDTWLRAHNDWVQPVQLGSGDLGYGVTATASSDKKTINVSYQGEVVRNTQVININAVLSIPV